MAYHASKKWWQNILSWVCSLYMYLQYSFLFPFILFPEKKSFPLTYRPISGLYGLPYFRLWLQTYFLLVFFYSLAGVLPSNHSLSVEHGCSDSKAGCWWPITCPCTRFNNAPLLPGEGKPPAGSTGHAFYYPPFPWVGRPCAGNSFASCCKMCNSLSPEHWCPILLLFSVWLLCLAVKCLLRSQIRITCSPPGHLMPHQEEFGLLASFSAIHPSHWRTGQAAVTEKPIIYCVLNVPSQCF